jgi:hypothetical protein
MKGTNSKLQSVNKISINKDALEIVTEALIATWNKILKA